MTTARVTLFLLVLVGTGAATAEGQIRGRLLDAARQALNRPSDPADLTVEQILDRATRCRYDDTACIERAKSANQLLVLTDARDEVLMDNRGRPIDDPSKLTPQQRAQLLRQAFLPDDRDEGAAAAGARPDDAEIRGWVRSCRASPPQGMQPGNVSAFCACVIDDLAESIAADPSTWGPSASDRAALARNFNEAYLQTPRFQDNPAVYRECFSSPDARRDVTPARRAAPQRRN